MAKSNTKTNKEDSFKLPQYLRLAKGAMWFDVDGDKASGVRLYTATTKLVGRGKLNEDEKLHPLVDQPTIVKDKNNNANFNEYGYVDVSIDEIPWYVDTTKIPTEKQSRLILAYKHKILIEADPKKPPQPIQDQRTQAKNFAQNKDGEMVFIGKNKEMFKRLQNFKFNELKEFVTLCPKTEIAKNNLIDMYHYEVKGYNKLSRARLEVLDLIRDKLKEFGPSISSVRVNEDDDLPAKK